MDAIRIENLRSLKDTGFIELKPLTLLIGKNSSGKSSFLRFFPLFKQSIMSKGEGVITWYDESLVDFGSFQESIRRSSESESEKEITFHFNFCLKKTTFWNKIKFISGNLYAYHDCNISLTVKIIDDDKIEGSSISRHCSLKLEDHHIILEKDEDGRVTKFQVNGFDIMEFTKLDFVSSPKNTLIPKIYSCHKENVEKKSNYFFWSIDLNTSIYSIIKKILHPLTSDDRILSIISWLGIGSSQDMLENMAACPVGTGTWKKKVESWSLESREFQELRDVVIAYMTIRLFNQIEDSYFYDVANNIKYIAPVRATAERYYRVRNTNLTEIDSKGQNLAMFLKNLKNLKNFQKWTMDFFGFSVAPISSKGHISLTMRDCSAEKMVFNMADMGFGYSQILPIILQLWLIISKEKRGRTFTKLQNLYKSPLLFAIEQPELHLHPGLQAKTVDFFISAIEAARKQDVDLRLIIETHSEVMINRIGQKIAEKKFDSKNVNVVLFEKETFEVSTRVRFSGYDEDGFLTNWPIGFMEPDEI